MEEFIRQLVKKINEIRKFEFRIEVNPFQCKIIISEDMWETEEYPVVYERD